MYLFQIRIKIFFFQNNFENVVFQASNNFKYFLIFFFIIMKRMSGCPNAQGNFEAKKSHLVRPRDPVHWTLRVLDKIRIFSQSIFWKVCCILQERMQRITRDFYDHGDKKLRSHFLLDIELFNHRILDYLHLTSQWKCY